MINTYLIAPARAKTARYKSHQDNQKDLAWPAKLNVILKNQLLTIILPAHLAALNHWINVLKLDSEKPTVLREGMSPGNVP